MSRKGYANDVIAGKTGKTIAAELASGSYDPKGISEHISGYTILDQPYFSVKPSIAGTSDRCLASVTINDHVNSVKVSLLNQLSFVERLNEQKPKS